MKAAAVIFRYRLFRVTRLFFPERILHQLGRMVGPLFFGRERGVVQRLMHALQLIHGNKFSIDEYHRLARRSLQFLGLLALDTILLVPNFTPRKIRERFHIVHPEYLEEALHKSEGIIVPWVHLSQFVRAAVLVHALAPGRRVQVIASPQYVAMLGPLIAWMDIRIISCAHSLDSLKNGLTRLLARGDLLLVAFDIGYNFGQLKVPVLGYLAPTPGSVVSLGSQTGALVLPAVITPCGDDTRHTLTFLQPFTIQSRGSKKDTLGYYNTYLNARFTPYLRQYPFLWEELLGWEKFRTMIPFLFPNELDIRQMIAWAANVLRYFVDSSWEANRMEQSLYDACDALARVAGPVTLPVTPAALFYGNPGFEKLSCEATFRGATLTEIFFQVLTFLQKYPAIGKMVHTRPAITFTPKPLDPEAHAMLVDALEGIIRNFGLDCHKEQTLENFS